jgi:hypothetical protein
MLETPHTASEYQKHTVISYSNDSMMGFCVTISRTRGQSAGKTL